MVYYDDIVNVYKFSWTHFDFFKCFIFYEEDQEVRDSKETLFLLLLPRQELQVHVNNLHLNLEIVGEVSEGGHMFGKPILANHMFTLAAGERTLQTGDV